MPRSPVQSLHFAIMPGTAPSDPLCRSVHHSPHPFIKRILSLDMRYTLLISVAVLCCTSFIRGESTAPAKDQKEPYESITDKEIAAIDFDDASQDSGFIAPLAQDLSHLDEDSRKRLDEITDKFDK